MLDDATFRALAKRYARMVDELELDPEPPDELAQFLERDRQQVETVLKDVGLVQQ